LVMAAPPLKVVEHPQNGAADYSLERPPGVVLGSKLRLVAYDTQSDNDKYTQYANTLILNDKTAVIMGGISSASREAIRPLMDRNNQLYFYNEQYEGGVCDKYVFCTGVVPSQQLDPLLRYALDNGTKKIYMLAADYNVGHITGDYVNNHLQGMSMASIDFFPLDVTDFSAVINKVQRSGADTIWSHLVGGNHIGFYRQLAAAGLQDKFKLLSSSYGLGNEHIVLAPNESKGWVVCYPFFQELTSPAARQFVADWHTRFGNNYPYVTDSANDVWIGWHLWAIAVNKAGSTERDKVIKALESDLTFDAPEGTVKLDAKTHHLYHSSHVAMANSNHGFDILKSQDNIPPNPGGQCNLISNPTLHTQQTW